MKILPHFDGNALSFVRVLSESSPRPLREMGVFLGLDSDMSRSRPG